jgi:molybdopterin-containing oxidoreductase family iron-sulfur binding subunit
LLDGRLASTPWAQQTPDPISSASWSTWAEINSKQAEDLDIRQGDVLLVRSTSGEIEVLAYPHPGVRPGVIGIPIGQGHEEGGRWAEGRGANVLSILVDQKDSETGALAWAATKVRVQRAGRRVKVPKFEGEVEARAVEPGVPVLVVGPGETAEEAGIANHHEYQGSLFND